MGIFISLVELVVEQPISTGVTGIILLLTYYLVIYPFYLSPLHKIPGPVLYKISKVFILNDQRTEQRNDKVDQLHRKYGTVVQIGPNEISLSSLTHLKDVYVKKNLSKTSFYAQFVNFGMSNAFSTLDTSIHLKKKKSMTSFYTKSSIFSRQSQENMNNKVNEVAKFIDSRLDTPVDVYTLFNALAMDVVTYYELGTTFATNLVQDVDERKVIDCFRINSSMWFYTTLLPKFWNYAATDKIKESGAYVRSWVGNIFQKAYESLEENETPIEENSLMKKLFDLGLTKWEIGSEIYDHIAAGHQTTGISLSFATWELSRPCNQYMQDKIYKELKDNFKDFESVDLEQLDKLPYLDAFITELTRLHAAIPGAEPREISKPNEYQIELSNGDTINLPKGTVVSVQPWTIHRNDDVFAYPNIFKPERWLKQEDETEQDFKKRYQSMKNMIFTFGSGTKMCLGMNIALVEMKTTIAKLYWNFQSKINPDWCNNYKDGDILMGSNKLKKNTKKQDLTDVELMAMGDSYTTRPLFDECWLDWSRRP